MTTEENETTSNSRTYLCIEFYNDMHEWVPTSSVPLPHSAIAGAQGLPERVWIAYVDYLNEREKFAPTATRGDYRLTRTTVTSTSEVLHV